jgi:hypothetical protein
LKTDLSWKKNAYLPLRQEIPYTPEKTDDAKNAGRRPCPGHMPTM